MIDPRFVILGAVVSFLGGMGYIAGTLRGTVQPNRVTWFIWALAPLVAFAAELQQGIGLRSLMTFMAGFVPALIFLATFFNHRSAWQLHRFDLLCGGLSLVGLFLWYLTRIGDVAIAFAILADGLAAVPTLAKAYVAPESESYVGFLSSAISAVITLLTVTTWTFANYGFPLYICIIALFLTILVKFRLGRRWSLRYA